MIRDIFKRQYFGWWLVCSRVTSTSVSLEFGKLPYDLVCIQCFSVALSFGGFFYIRIISIGLVNSICKKPFVEVFNFDAILNHIKSVSDRKFLPYTQPLTS